MPRYRSLGADAVGGEDCEEPVSQKLQYFTATLRHRVADAFEMLIEPADDFRALSAVDESREAAEIGEQQCLRYQILFRTPSFLKVMFAHLVEKRASMNDHIQASELIENGRRPPS